MRSAKASGTAESAAERAGILRWTGIGGGPEFQTVGLYQTKELVDALGKVVKGIDTLPDQDSLLRLIVRELCALVGVSRGSVYLRDPASSLFKGQVGYADRPIDNQVKRLICGVTADGFTEEIVRTRAPVVIRDAHSDARPVRSTMRAWDVATIMGVPMLYDGDVIGLIFVDTKGETHEFTLSDRTLASMFADVAAAAVAHVRLYRDLRSSHDTVVRQNKMLRRFNAVDDRLTSLVLEGCNLAEIAEAVAELTLKPTAVYDSCARCLAASAPPRLTPTAPSIFSPEARRHPQVVQALDALSPSEPAVIGPFPVVGIVQRVLLAPVTVRDEQWATLMITEQRTHLTAFDVLVSRRTAALIALEMSVGRREASAFWDAEAAFLREVIRGGFDAAQIESRATFLQMSLHAPHVLCLVAGAGASGTDALRGPDHRAVAAALRDALPDPRHIMATEVMEGVALAVELPGGEFLSAQIERVKTALDETCCALPSDRGLIAGVSGVCAGPTDYARAYGQTQQVIRCLDAFRVGNSPAALSADDLGPGRVFLATCDPEGARSFARETLGALIDNPRSADLLGTLACFFKQNRRIRVTAETLGLHENTIRYRLARIEELTGLAVATESKVQLNVQLALLVLRLQGRLPAIPNRRGADGGGPL